VSSSEQPPTVDAGPDEGVTCKSISEPASHEALPVAEFEVDVPLICTDRTLLPPLRAVKVQSFPTPGGLSTRQRSAVAVNAGIGVRPLMDEVSSPAEFGAM
jgi:hypothetical protein